jgi:hypothetical protein
MKEQYPFFGMAKVMEIFIYQNFRKNFYTLFWVFFENVEKIQQKRRPRRNLGRLLPNLKTQ